MTNTNNNCLFSNNSIVIMVVVIAVAAAAGMEYFIMFIMGVVLGVEAVGIVIFYYGLLSR